MGLPGHDLWKTDTPPEVEEIELHVSRVPDKVLRRALRDALKDIPERGDLPTWSLLRKAGITVRDLMEVLVVYAYKLPFVLLTPQEAEEYRSDQDEAACDRALHQSQRRSR